MNSDTPRTDAALKSSQVHGCPEAYIANQMSELEREWNQARRTIFTHGEAIENLERERDEWRKMAEELEECAMHGPNCVPFEDCDCGLKESLARFNALKAKYT